MTITFYYLNCPACHEIFAVNAATKSDTHIQVYSCNICGETLPKRMFKSMGRRNGNDLYGEDIRYYGNGRW